MNEPDPKQAPPGENPSPGGATERGDIERTLEFGEHLIGFIRDATDLARIEALLAVKSMPRLVMLWFLMMPILLLTWCSFSAMIAWGVYALSANPGFGFVAFFVLQLLILMVCRWRYSVYKARITLPYTRQHLGNFIRGFNHEPDGARAGKKYPANET